MPLMSFNDEEHLTSSLGDGGGVGVYLSSVKIGRKNCPTLTSDGVAAAASESVN